MVCGCYHCTIVHYYSTLDNSTSYLGTLKQIHCTVYNVYTVLYKVPPKVHCTIFIVQNGIKFTHEICCTRTYRIKDPEKHFHLSSTKNYGCGSTKTTAAVRLKLYGCTRRSPSLSLVHTVYMSLFIIPADRPPV